MNSPWIDRYIYAVTRHLPERQRADIDKELRGLIEDMLEGRLTDKPATDADVEAVLLELGDPAQLADKYRGHQRYLIGPELYPTYILVLKIVAAAIAGAMAIVFVIQTVIAPTRLLENFWGGMTALFGGLFQGFAWVTISLGVAEYVREQKGLGAQKPVAWKLVDLPQLPEVEVRIGRSDPIASIVFTTLFTFWLTLNVSTLGIWILAPGVSGTVIPFLNETVFRAYLPWVWAIAALSVATDIAKLVAGRWSLRLLALDVVVAAASLGLAFTLFSDAAVWNPQFLTQLSEAGLVVGSDATQSLGQLWAQATSGLRYLIALIGGIQIVLTLARMVRLFRGRATRAASDPAPSA